MCFNRRVTYTNEIIEGPDGPLFRVTASDNPDYEIVEKSATAAWRIAWLDLVKAGTNKKVTSEGHAPSGPVRVVFRPARSSSCIVDAVYNLT